MDIPVACPQAPPQIDGVQRCQFDVAISDEVFRGASTTCELERRLAHILKAEAFARGATKSSQARFDDRGNWGHTTLSPPTNAAPSC